MPEVYVENPISENDLRKAVAEIAGRSLDEVIFGRYPRPPNKILVFQGKYEYIGGFNPFSWFIRSSVLPGADGEEMADDEFAQKLAKMLGVSVLYEANDDADGPLFELPPLDFYVVDPDGTRHLVDPEVRDRVVLLN